MRFMRMIEKLQTWSPKRQNVLHLCALVISLGTLYVLVPQPEPVSHGVYLPQTSHPYAPTQSIALMQQAPEGAIPIGIIPQRAHRHFKTIT
jgi:hypothetical protein